MVLKQLSFQIEKVWGLPPVLIHTILSLRIIEISTSSEKDNVLILHDSPAHINYILFFFFLYHLQKFHEAFIDIFLLYLQLSFIFFNIKGLL